MNTSPPRPLLLGLCLLAGLSGLYAAIWSWRQAMRPGRVHFERGLDFAAAKQLPQAEEEWRAGTRQDPAFPDNYAQLGDLYAAMGRSPAAAEQYAAATRLAPHDGTLFLHLARADEAIGRLEGALAAAARAAALRPDDAEALGFYGELAAKMNQPQIAYAPLARAHTLVPEDADLLIYLVRVEFQRQDLAAVERDLTPFVRRHPDNSEACYLIASLLHQQPQTAATLKEALDYAQRAHAGAPSNADASVLLGQVLLDMRQPEQALPAFRQAQVLAPNSVLALHGLLTCYIQLGQPGQAEQTKAALNAALVRIVRMGHASDKLLANPGNTAAALELAQLQEQNREFSQARLYYRQAARYAPQDARAQAALAAFLQRTGQSKP